MSRQLVGHVAVHPETGEYLCRDDQWRALPHFGTLRTCVRLYRSSTWALKASSRRARIPHEPNRTLAHAVSLYSGDQLERGGNVRRTYA